ncbi:permease for cytosine/purines- uracil- thiamine- allantoin-domain-containing protein [Apiospora hydei]|uniref:Permease for cytosine/purines- uracil-thiamine-allantoin-domain-containing protein n=1 Tax=Apiospora hydei TaxID=1337664 RepID=A0ABR1XAI6_9PEZI
MDFQQMRRRSGAIRDKAYLRVTQPSSWELPKQASSIAPPDVWTNADQDPVPEEKRTWTKWAFITYWFSDIITMSTWMQASAIMTMGLSATDAILIVMAAGLCNAVPTVLNGAVGSELHIPFPIAIRASYGYHLSYFCVVVRGIIAMFWFGVQSANGGSCVTTILTAIWPSYARFPNHLPKSAGTTSQGLLSYFRMFWIKTALVPPMALAMVVWITARAGGQGEFFYAPATVSGSKRAWLWLSNLTAITGGYSTLAVNIPDFSRFSKSRGAQIWQLPVIPLFKTVCGVFGIISASASRQLYGQTYWSPLEIIAQWQSTPGGRAAAFFASSIWLLAQISVNISANSISFANDITTLAPRYVNIRRGVIFVSLVGGWAMCPWLIVSSAATFLNFMSSAASFMGPIAGILFADYWLVKRKRYDVPALYDPRGIYGTWNWRAAATTFVVIAPLLPGIANKVTPQNVRVGTGIANLFSINWLYGFFAAIAMYWALNCVAPDRRTLIPDVVPGYSDAGQGPLQGIQPGDVESGRGSRSSNEKTAAGSAKQKQEGADADTEKAASKLSLG